MLCFERSVMSASSFVVYAVSASAPDCVVASFDTVAEANAAAWLANSIDSTCDYRVDEVTLSDLLRSEWKTKERMSGYELL